MTSNLGTGEAGGDFGLVRIREEGDTRLRSSIEGALKRAFVPSS